MLKKILIFALSLNTAYVLPSDSSASPGENLGFGCAALVSGIICAWLVSKDLINVWRASKEEDRQLEILNNMGVKAAIKSESKFEVGFLSHHLVVKNHYSITIPSGFSLEQQEQAKKHWNLLLESKKKANKDISVLAGLGALILIPAGIAGIIKGIQNFQ